MVLSATKTSLLRFTGTSGWRGGLAFTSSNSSWTWKLTVTLVILRVSAPSADGESLPSTKSALHRNRDVFDELGRLIGSAPIISLSWTSTIALSVCVSFPYLDPITLLVLVYLLWHIDILRSFIPVHANAVHARLEQIPQ
jgi:hypothetical protein